MSGLSERSRHDQKMHREVAGMYRRRAGYAFAEAFQQERNDLVLSLAPPADEGRVLASIPLLRNQSWYTILEVAPSDERP